MKRIMLFMMLMLGTVSAVMAQGADVPATDYDAMIGTFAGFGAVDPEIAWAKLATLKEGARRVG